MRLCIGVVVLTLAACGRSPAEPVAGSSGGGSGATVIATQPTVPDEQADEFADIATNASDLQKAWTRFGLQGEPPAADFDRSALLFVAFGESGSCPARFDELSI